MDKKVEEGVRKGAGIHWRSLKESIRLQRQSSFPGS